MSDDLQRKNVRVLLYSLGLVAGMVGLAFASVPLYDLFCRVTGFGGTTQTAQAAPDEVGERTFRIRFVSNIGRDLDWRFEPETREVTVRSGEPALVSYWAENLSERPLAGTAVYNVTPASAGLYFNKTQCFCFQEQVLTAGQGVDMPVYFFVDPQIENDPELDTVTTITLSYTFYPTESDALDEAIEDYYRSVQMTNATPVAGEATGG